MSQTLNRIAVFQHLKVEHPGVFRDFLAADGIRWDVFELDEGATIPELSAYDALWVMGGPMDVWEEQAHPWLVTEKAAIQYAVAELKLPFLGVCLGHQLLADALGGKVAKAAIAEVGIMDVQLTQAGQDHGLFAALPGTLTTLQWHGAEVTEIPHGATILAASDHCAVQAMVIESHAASIQFHVEITEHTIDEWGAVPAYQTSLQQSLGNDGAAIFKQQTNANMSNFNANARTFYDNWRGMIGSRP